MGLAVDLLSTGGEAAERIHPSETVILANPRMVMPSDALARLADGSEPLVFTIANTPEHEAFELIDADSRWPGWARVPGEDVCRTASQLGEWDLASTLMRVAVQAGARRCPLPLDEMVYLVDAADAVSYAEALLASHETTEFEDWWGERIAARLAPLALRHDLDARLITFAGNALVAGAAVAAATYSLLAAVFALLSGLWLALAGERLLAVERLQFGLGRTLRRLRSLCATIVLVSVAVTLWRTSGQWGGLLLGGVVAVAVAVARGSKRSGYRLDVTTVAVLFAFGWLIGAPLTGLCLAALASTVSLAIEYRDLRRAQPR